jgi:hypothetical protein
MDSIPGIHLLTLFGSMRKSHTFPIFEFIVVTPLNYIKTSHSLQTHISITPSSVWDFVDNLI